MLRLTKAQARQIAVRAQLDAQRSTDLVETVRRLTLLQLDDMAACLGLGEVDLAG